MFENTWLVPEEYTYRDMTKPERREWMSKCGVAKLGTKAGGFGPFTEEFRVLSVSELDKLRTELKRLGVNEKNAPLAAALIK